ncbi:MAG TPA: hypothetical protein VGB73_07095 [Pyrinomonadaceae bacterium]|jgi:hypothetical protein
MKIDELFPRWRIVALGAINGLLFSFVVRAAMRIDFEYKQRELAEIAGREGVYICIAENPFKWWVIPLACIILFSLASYAAHRIYLKRIKSTILLWGIIGLVGGGLPFIAIYLNDKVSHLLSNIEGYLGGRGWGQSPDFLFIPRLEVVLLVLAALVGLLYGGIVHFASTRYYGKGKA